MSTLDKALVPDERKIQLAKDFSFSSHLVSIHQASEQRLKLPHPLPSLVRPLISPLQVPGVITGAESEPQQKLEDLGTGSSASQGQLDSSSGQEKILDLLDIYIDAKDSVNYWCVAKIIEHDIPNSRIKIHFDGWSPRYDEVVRIGSSRVAHFRRYTSGYTGQNKVALRDFNLNYGYQVTLLNRMKKIRESEFRCFDSATECTQFLRGELFIYFDSLISLLSEASQNDLDRIYEFAGEVFKLVIKWLEIFPKYLEAYKLNHKHPNLFIVDINAAISQCGYELIDMVKKCAGLCDRSRKFFKQFKTTTRPCPLADPSLVEENGYMLSVFSQFHELGGFKRIFDLIRIGGISPDFKFPIPLISHSVSIFTLQTEIGFKTELAVEIATDIVKSIEEKLKAENLTDSEIKEINLEDLKTLLGHLARFKDVSLQRERTEMDEFYELEISKRFLMCPFFEKRIKGMKEFKMIQEKLVRRETKSQQEGRSLTQGKPHLLDMRSFSEWILNNKVVEFIFKENVHQELIKRSQCILYILAQDSDTFPETIVNLIWQCCSADKHEDVIRVTYELITELASSLPKPRLLNFKELIQKIPLSQIDEKTILFIKDFTLNTFNNLKMISLRQTTAGSAQKKQEGGRVQQKKGGVVLESQPGEVTQVAGAKDQNELYYDLTILWRFAQDSNKYISNKSKELALNCLIEVLNAGAQWKPQMRDPFITLTLDNIQRGDTVYFSVIFLQNLIATYPTDDQKMGGSHSSSQSSRSRQTGRQQPQSIQEITIESLINELLRTVDLYGIVINQAAKYMGIFRQKMAESEEESKQSEESSQIDSNRIGRVNEGVKSQVSHQDYIKTFLSFFEFIVVNSRSITLKFNHVQEMFRIFVTEAVSELETREFFNFLTKQNPNARTRERLYLLDEKLRIEVFTQIMGNEKAMNCINLNQQAYGCFKNLFMGVNQQEGNLVLDQDGQIVSVNSVKQLQGINSLWKIGLYCHNEEVKEDCRRTLCDLHLQIKQKSPQFLQKTHETFTKTCKLYLESAIKLAKRQTQVSENLGVVLDGIKLIKTYCQRSDKEHFLAELERQAYQQTQRNMKQVIVKMDPGSQRNEFNVNVNCNFWELMRQVAIYHKMKITEFYILTKQGVLSEEFYNNQMKDFDIAEVQMQRKALEIIEKESPSFVIGYNKEMIQLFLEALVLQHQSITQEVISLLDLLQVNPESKQELADKINNAKPLTSKILQEETQDDEVISTAPLSDEALLLNFKDWSIILSWEQSNSDLSRTLYQLMCLRELIIQKSQQAPPKLLTQQNQQNSQNQLQQIQQIHQQERAAKQQFQKTFAQKGGYHFLIHMLNTIKKDVDFEKETIVSKTLQLIIGLLGVLQNQKLQQKMQVFEQPRHTGQMLDCCQIIVYLYLNSVAERLKQKSEEIREHHLRLHPESSQISEQIVYNQLQNEQFDTQILSASLNFIVQIVGSRPASYKYLQSSSKFSDILVLGLVSIPSEQVQKIVSLFCQNLFQRVQPFIIEYLQQKIGKPDASESEVPSFGLMRLFIIQFLPLALTDKVSVKMKVLFKLANQIFRETKVFLVLDQIKPPVQICQELIDIIYQRDIREATSRDEDSVLAGLFEFLGQVLVRFSQVRVQMAGKKKLVEFLTHQGLFKKEIRQIGGGESQTALNPPPLCKNSVSRNACLDLLRILSFDDLDLKLSITSYVQSNICNETYWRTPRKTDWNIQVQKQERSLSGFVGLKNLGCICYMNSILQQLYMIPAFRRAILEVEDRQAEQQPLKDNVLFQVKSIFGGLMELEKQYLNPKNFCNAFKDITGSPIDPYVQKDVDEFFNMFMDKIENLIRGTKEEKVINNTFQGVLANECICIDCPHYSENEEPFLAISLQVKNKASVQDSLKFYVEGEMLEGDNAYFCEKCEKKVSTLKRCCIKRLPNTLFLVLKRFEFDFDTMQKVKVNDYCEFPLDLDMTPYCQQELARQDLIKKMEEKSLSVDDLSEEELLVLNRKVPESYYQYKLKGIVVHYGTAEQGHYYSFIQDRESKNGGWFEFNDTLVKDFDPSDIPEEAFGGEDMNVQNNIAELQQQRGQVDQAMIQTMRQFKTKIKNAYVLIYDRVEMFDQARIKDIIDDPKTITVNAKELAKMYQSSKIIQSQQLQTMPQIPHNVHDLILAKNKKFWLSKTIFSQSFINQMLQILKSFDVKEDNDYRKYAEPGIDVQKHNSDSQLELLRFLATFFLTVSVRSADKSVIPNFINTIKEALKKHIGLCIWLIEIFSSQDFIKEFFIDSPVHEMTRLVQGLLKTAMIQVYNHEHRMIEEYIQFMRREGGCIRYIQQSANDLIDEVIVVDAKKQPENHDFTMYSGCQSATVLKMKNLPKNLPRLIVLINSFIHMSTSIHYHRQYKLSGIFWMTFSNFAMLGDQARHYLLQTRMLGRMLDIYINIPLDNYFSKEDSLNFATKFRDLSLRQDVPLIVYSKNLYIGIDPERGQCIWSSADRKAIFQTAPSYSVFLILAISILTRSCSFFQLQGLTKRSQFALDSLNYMPDKEEFELLQTQNNYRWWYGESLAKVSRNAVALMFAHICYENKEFSLEYLKELFDHFRNKESVNLYEIERPLLRCAQIEDNFAPERIKRMIQKLYETAKFSTSFFVSMEVILDLILKISERCPLFTQTLNSKQFTEFVSFLEKYQREFQTLPVGAGKQRIFKEGNLNWSEIKSSIVNQQSKYSLNILSEIDWIANYTKNRTNKMLKIIRGNLTDLKNLSNVTTAFDLYLQNQQGILTPSLENSSPSSNPSGQLTFVSFNSPLAKGYMQRQYDDNLFDNDDDLFMKNIEPGDQIDFMYNNIWYLGIVESDLGEMIRCQYSINNVQKIQHWIETESDKLAPPKSMSQSDKELMRRFILELSNYIVRSQQGYRQ